ncbi:MAG: sterol desaturase family protein [Polyangiaceae bacterium]|nr:sterol desaturase family protein [Polyangiaceae bacterium]
MNSISAVLWAVGSMAVSFALLAVVFGPLERLFPARPGQRVRRPELLVDACFFAGQYLLFAGLVTGALTWLYGHWRQLFPLEGFLSTAANMPVWLQAVVAIVAGDLLVYWFHRACHHFDLLWRFHAVHHSVEHLDWLAAHREHPLDGLFTQALLNLPGIVLGVHFELLGALIVFRGMWAIFIHSNVRLPVGPLKYLFGAPELHHHHHAKVPRTLHNFANLAPYLDLLFGTYHCPEGEETYPLGLVDPWPRGYVAQLLYPFGVELPRRRTRRVELNLAQNPTAADSSTVRLHQIATGAPPSMKSTIGAEPPLTN